VTFRISARQRKAVPGLDDRPGSLSIPISAKAKARPASLGSRNCDLSLIIACYNEQHVFAESVRQIINTLDHTSWTYEIIFVDDCSQDQTQKLIRDLLAADGAHNLRRLFHTENRGRGSAVSDGITLAHGRIVGFIDIDLEIGARYIPPCILAIEDGYDVATGCRCYKFTWRGLLRYLLSLGYTRLERLLLSVNLKDTESGLKFFNREKILPILRQTQDEGWFWDTEIMVRSYLANLRIVEIPCVFLRRFDKKSSVKLIGTTLEYLRKILAFRKAVASLRRTEATA
jgi:glycosyltransferase AglD